MSQNRRLNKLLYQQATKYQVVFKKTRSRYTDMERCSGYIVNCSKQMQNIIKYELFFKCAFKSICMHKKKLSCSHQITNRQCPQEQDFRKRSCQFLLNAFPYCFKEFFPITMNYFYNCLNENLPSQNKLKNKNKINMKLHYTLKNRLVTNMPI